MIDGEACYASSSRYYFRVAFHLHHRAGKGMRSLLKIGSEVTRAHPSTLHLCHTFPRQISSDLCTIMKVELPNGHFANYDDEAIATALGEASWSHWRLFSLSLFLCPHINRPPFPCVPRVRGAPGADDFKVPAGAPALQNHPAVLPGCHCR